MAFRICRKVLSTTNSTSLLQNARSISIKGIIFDMDGTLTVPVLDFKMLRERLNVGADVDLLEHAQNAPPAKQSKIYKIIEDFEDEGLERLKFQDNLHRLFYYLQENNIRRGLLTRNNRKAVDVFVTKFLRDDKINVFKKESDIFSIILTRDFQPPKPHPEPVIHICSQWNISAQNVLVVGDNIDDISSGRDAGAVTILKVNNTSNTDGTTCGEELNADFQIDDLLALKDILENS